MPHRAARPYLPQRPDFKLDLAGRHARGNFWRLAFMLATIGTIVFLATLVLTIVDDAFGYVVMVNEVDPASLARDGVRLEDQSAEQLRLTLEEQLSPRRARALERESPLAERPAADLHELVLVELVKPNIAATYGLIESIFERGRIVAESQTAFPGSVLSFRSWINWRFMSTSQTARPLTTGVLTAFTGTLLTILITIVVAFPLGIAAAVWLEEYAVDNRLNRFIQLNIYNLAGVPSIIYGMLGLAVFVRGLEPITSGALFGAGSGGDVANGRTILSAGLTLALLILPVIIINGQEALRAIPGSLRHSSLAVGATKWQTVWSHLLPASLDRILTGTVLAVSRAIGETAPLVVIGASTFLTQDPTGIFSKFTTLPMQIYQWTSRPQPEFRHIAAAAILVLLGLMLSLNAFAIITRNKLRKNRRSA
ncbi:MAG: phosphate ABC transporter, permease protein PstA [Spirochaetes bacterium GWD1_61_31]|nr:MAG: phosphate ABC transporter, permease protein PstA [Spirochaetes bacterium GWB1_60_80]OHD31323.1 MAG: phosphate ABC transporter, permease protein PstA [Spirochaetes bacterium GWC1_61_12]OHD39511.1 MAG: phosphate ABC transporter, permease protein PstA [Spirochaetes bacterium GWD1_61_31]OHD45564.1 MAG: phosphate ABC transporter, permease protein PstA [Spirochaetes bacterium GWE1_60_18]OHD58136.1 MAG: phosphate ABC transporter, permease protein PstA [Spirochaetes bacterium GWF1_60_12]